MTTIPTRLIELEDDMYYSLPKGFRYTVRRQWLEILPGALTSTTSALKEPWTDPDGLAEAVKEELCTS